MFPKISADWEAQHYPLPTLDEEDEMTFTRRTASDRKAEAAVYRARTEAATIPTVPLSRCEFDNKRRVLKLASEFFGMPREFFVESHHTGKTVRFVVVNEHDRLFDPDQWDGEQQVYRPVGTVPNVDHMVIYHAW